MKKHLKSSFFYIAIGFLPLASNFLLTPFFTRYLSPAEYGVLALAALFQSYLNVMLALGIDGAFSRLFFQYYRKPKLLNSLFSTVLLCVLAVAVLYFIGLQFAGDQVFALAFENDEFTYSRYGNIIFITAVTSLLHTIGLSYYRNSEAISAFALLSISLFVLMTTGSVIGVIVLKLGAMGSLLGKLAGSVLTVGAFLVVFFRRHPLRFRARFLKPAYRFGLPLVPYLLLGLTLDNLDRIFVDQFLDLSELGKYNIAFLIASLVAVILQSMMSAIQPSIFKLLEDRRAENETEIDREINVLFRGLHLFIITLIVGVVVISYPLVVVFIDKKYHSIVHYLPILFLAYLPRLYYIIYGLPLFFYHKTRLLPVINLISLLIGIAAMYGLIITWGIVGVCLGVLLIKVVQTIAVVHFVRRHGYLHNSIYAMRPNHILSAAVTAMVIISVALSYRFPDLTAWLNLAVGLLFVVLVLVFFQKEVLLIKKKAISFIRR